MRKILLLFGLIGLLIACNPAKEAQKSGEQMFGEVITPEGAVDVKTIPGLLADKDSVEVKISGDVVAACQAKGCWMNMQLNDETTMMVRFKDYGFFVPKDAAGTQAIAEGWAFKTVTSVEDLKHYAEDEGLSQEEIDEITEPKEEIAFVAHGVILTYPEAEKTPDSH